MFDFDLFLFIMNYDDDRFRVVRGTVYDTNSGSGRTVLPDTTNCFESRECECNIRIYSKSFSLLLCLCLSLSLD